jgi:hypothetical protein
MSLLSFFQWCYQTPIGETIRNSTWMFPAIEAIHLLDRMTGTPTGIIFGLDKELRPYLDRLGALATHKFAGLELIEGELAGTRVVLANAEGNGQIMIDKENYFLSGEGLLMPTM